MQSSGDDSGAEMLSRLTIALAFSQRRSDGLPHLLALARNYRGRCGPSGRDDGSRFSQAEIYRFAARVRCTRKCGHGPSKRRWMAVRIPARWTATSSARNKRKLFEWSLENLDGGFGVGACGPLWHREPVSVRDEKQTGLLVIARPRDDGPVISHNRCEDDSLKNWNSPRAGARQIGGRNPGGAVHHSLITAFRNSPPFHDAVEDFGQGYPSERL